MRSKRCIFKRITFGLLTALSLSSSFAQQNYFQQKVDNRIDVTLNDKTHSLDGFIRMEYTNNSPDSINYIWFHLWPNAYKNDQTAFSDQLLKLGRTDFYFSDDNKRGYINRLDFKVNGISARLEDHPEHVDIGKLVLPISLAPGKQIVISTPFHIQLPHNFSRSGHVAQSYQVTQWYPKPAVYDSKGWHPMPYLEQGEFYSEFGNFDVQITVPKNYVVAATGENESEPVVTSEQKTLRYKQDNVHDFAWFADQKFIMESDTLQLPSGRTIKTLTYYLPGEKTAWKKSISFLKDAVRNWSTYLGEYPYNVVTAVEAPKGFPGGMEYPTITAISPGSGEKELDKIIAHEVGHNWNYGILASNERDHPWMDEGINSYYESRYMKIKYAEELPGDKKSFMQKRLPENSTDMMLRTLFTIKHDQPIATASDKLDNNNYALVTYYKTSEWMNMLEKELGQQVLDQAMQEFYTQWKFKHPYPEDLKAILEKVSGKDLGNQFLLLEKKGPLEVETQKKQFKLVGFAGARETRNYNYLFTGPAIGINYYDKIMLGIFIHNYTLPPSRIQFFAAPMYATGSKKITGLARLGYSWYSYGKIQKTEISLAAGKFTSDVFVDSTGRKNYLGFRKLVPSFKMNFRAADPTGKINTSVQWKTYFIEEDVLTFMRDPVTQVEHITYPKVWRYINQLKFVKENPRILYPYNIQLNAEQAKEFIRTSLTANYFFNYVKGGGMAMRLFAGKFIYLGDKTSQKQFETDRFHLNMTGPRGYEDYTYTNYFAGRTEFSGFRSQQIMMRDGGFKVRTDLLSNKIGKTDDWLTAVNFNTDIPKNINPLSLLPVKIPLKIFADVGTYAEAWDKNSATGKFIYDAGFQVSLLQDLVNIYIPVLYSKVYRDYIKSTISGNRFLKNISFSIDIHNFNIRKYLNHLPL